MLILYACLMISHREDAKLVTAAKIKVLAEQRSIKQPQSGATMH